MPSPQMVRDFWLGSTQRFLQPLAERQIPIVLHMDGDFSRVTDCLLELPLSAIHPFEVTGMLSICDFKARYGDRITVWGNIDLSRVLVFGSPEEVAADVREHVRRSGAWRPVPTRVESRNPFRSSD